MNIQKPNPQDLVMFGEISFSHHNIFSVVNDFYLSVQKDPKLADAFRSVHDWPEHIDRITHFWWIRFGGRSYMFSEYNPVLKHFFAGFSDELLQVWINLFEVSLKKNLTDSQVNLWLDITKKMGQGLSVRNKMLHKRFEQEKDQTDK